MKLTDHPRERLRKGNLALRWLAILSLTGLFSVLVTPLGASAATNYTVTLTPSSSEMAVGSQVTLTASVNNSPADNTMVKFSITSGPNSGYSESDPTTSGQATFTYSSGTAGEDTIKAEVVVSGSDTTTPDTATVDWSALNLSPSIQYHSTDQQASLQAHLTSGGTLSGVTIHYSVSNSLNSGNCLNIPDTAVPTPTNGSGVTTISYSRDSSCVGTTDTVTAWADSNGTAGYQLGQDPTSNSAQVVWQNYQLSVTTSTSTANVGAPATVTATVRNQNGAVVSGVPVGFFVSPTNNTTGQLPVDTNSAGHATFTYTGSTAETDTITAYIDTNTNNQYDSGEPTAATTINWINLTFTLTPTTQNVTAGTQVSLTGNVTDVNDNGVSGVRIRYNISGANTAGGSVITDSNGNGTFSYIAGNSGTDTVTAYLDLNTNNTKDTGEPSDTATVYVTSANLSLTPTSQTVATNTQASLTASLSNSNVSTSGVVIRYSVSGANSTSGTVTTDANGNATINYTGTHAGADTVTVYADYNNNGSMDGGEPSATATVNWTLTATLKLSPTTTTPGVGTTSYSAVSLTTSEGGVPGVPIRYTVTGVNPTSGSMTTDGNGNTVISFNGTNTGTDTLTAYADMNKNGVQDSGEPTATVTINWGGSSGGTTPPPSTFQPAQPTTAKAGCTYFAATGHNLCAGFQAYWNKFGGLNIFGMPITEEFQENGVTVQYFERARFEWHPGAWPSHFDVLLGLLGDEVTQGRGNETPFQATTASNGAGCTYFAQTGHNLCGTFNQYWNQFGGLAVYGYPISEAFQEKNPDTGQTYLVQYFERARFELQPGVWPAHLNVLLGRLGVEVLSMKYGTSMH